MDIIESIGYIQQKLYDDVLASRNKNIIRRLSYNEKDNSINLYCVSINSKNEYEMIITIVLPKSTDDLFFIYYTSDIYDFDNYVEKINEEITSETTVFILMNNIKNELEKYFKREDNEIIHPHINTKEICSLIIKNHLESNLIGYDLLFSLFTMSIRSYRHMRICDPYPKILQNFSQPIIDEIVSIPSFDSINYDLLTDNQLITLLWLVNDLNTKLELYEEKEKHGKYSYCFKVDKFYNSINFEKLKSKKGYYTSYHGSNIENYHNILHNGLLNMSGSKNERNGSIMGEGIYTSSHLKTCLHFCNSCPFYWKNSKFVKNLNKFEFPFMIICECEVIKDEKKVKLKSHNGDNVTIEEKPYIICEDKNLLTITKLYLYNIYSNNIQINDKKRDGVVTEVKVEKEKKKKDNRKNNAIYEMVIIIIILSIIIKLYM